MDLCFGVWYSSGMNCIWLSIIVDVVFLISVCDMWVGIIDVVFIDEVFVVLLVCY